MKLLLTSAGITNPSIRAALLGLLGRPIEACAALVISTASYPLRGGPKLARDFIAGEEPETPMAELGWRSVGVLELTALPSLPRDVWVAEVQAADVLLGMAATRSTSTAGCASPDWRSSSRRSTSCTWA